MVIVYDIAKIYKTVGIEQLILKVNAMILDGWKPQGGICESKHAYIQAMIKEIKK